MLIHFYVGSFSYTSHASFTFIWEVSLTHPMLALLFFGEFLLHIPSWLLLFFSFSSFSFFFFFHFFFKFFYSFFLTHPVLASLLSGEFLLHIPCWLHFFNFFFNLGSFSYTSRAGFISIWGVCITHPMLD